MYKSIRNKCYNVTNPYKACKIKCFRRNRKCNIGVTMLHSLVTL
uniref:Uncharacterized protein n=1 Tax=Siphoviridae sp. ctGMq5 TaxID=2826220 RepID=A0A8S5NNL6_9CAUD|nr:MAG TPA: hypothetical protein [Siphoviridae sp. ctGMq5]